MTRRDDAVLDSAAQSLSGKRCPACKHGHKRPWWRRRAATKEREQREKGACKRAKMALNPVVSITLAKRELYGGSQAMPDRAERAATRRRRGKRTLKARPFAHHLAPNLLSLKRAKSTFPRELEAGSWAYGRLHQTQLEPQRGRRRGRTNVTSADPGFISIPLVFCLKILTEY